VGALRSGFSKGIGGVKNRFGSLGSQTNSQPPIRFAARTMAVGGFVHGSSLIAPRRNVTSEVRVAGSATMP